MTARRRKDEVLTLGRLGETRPFRNRDEELQAGQIEAELALAR